MFIMRQPLLFCHLNSKRFIVPAKSRLHSDISFYILIFLNHVVISLQSCVDLLLSNPIGCAFGVLYQKDLNFWKKLYKEFGLNIARF